MTSLFLQTPMTTEVLMDCTKVSGGYSRPSIVLTHPLSLGLCPGIFPVHGPGDPEETPSPHLVVSGRHNLGLQGNYLTRGHMP